MLQVDHVYEFFYSTIFKDFDVHHCLGGVINPNQITSSDIAVFTPGLHTTKKIFFYDQEPLLDTLTDLYFDMFSFPAGTTLAELLEIHKSKNYPYGFSLFAHICSLRRNRLDLNFSNSYSWGNEHEALNRSVSDQCYGSLYTLRAHS